MKPPNSAPLPPGHILVVEPDQAVMSSLVSLLLGMGHKVSQAHDWQEALAVLEDYVFQLIIADHSPMSQDNEELVKKVAATLPHTPIILMTDNSSVDAAVKAMRQGAFDLHQKPLDLKRMCMSVTRGLEKASLQHAYDFLRRREPYIYKFEHIVAESRAMKEVLDQASKLAATDITVLITGETGTGKSLLAGAIHANSPRREGNLITVNCAALSETLLESELFGHEKGAFTGAHKARAGRFQAAHGGSLFLDEVGDMSPATQAKVLRAIEEKLIERVGGSRSIKVDVRILAATNRNLPEAVKKNAFRQDLFYRLNVAPIRLPPLSERPEDILPLASRFLNSTRSKGTSQPEGFTPEAEKALLNHRWSGNIRELRNLVERGVLFCSGPLVTPADMGMTPNSASAPAPARPETLNLASLERWAVEQALERAENLQRRAAEILGITPRALSYKLKKLGIR